MKNLLFLIIILQHTLVAQIDFSTEVPKIGYYDLYLLDYEDDTTNLHFTSADFYYPELDTLGLNYVYSQADENSLGSSNPGIKIIDAGFRNESGPSEVLFHYMKASGNKEDFYPYHVGGGDYAQLDSNNIGTTGITKFQYYYSSIMTLFVVHFNKYITNFNTTIVRL